MKQMKKWHLGYALQLAVLFLMCTGMAACSDEETSDNLYSVGFETLQSDNTEFMAEMKEIETIFYGELGITDSSFRLNGDQAECDAQVKPPANGQPPASINGNGHSISPIRSATSLPRK